MGHMHRLSHSEIDTMTGRQEEKGDEHEGTRLSITIKAKKQ